MKKVWTMAAALLVVLALGATTAVAGQSGGGDNDGGGGNNQDDGGNNDDNNEVFRVDTDVSISFVVAGPAPYYQQSYFRGVVEAKKGCQRGRVVTLKKVNAPNQGSDTTGRDGVWQVPITASTSPGQYFAKVAFDRRVRKNGNVVKCLRAVSPTIP